MRARIVAVIVLCAQAGIADEVEALRQEIRAAEERLELSRRLLPLDFNPADEQQFFARVAESARVSVDLKPAAESESVVLETGGPSGMRLHWLDVTGRGRLGEIAFFLELAGIRNSRFADLESLRVDSDGDGPARFAARFALPVYGEVPIPPPPSVRTIEAALRQRVDFLRSLNDLMESWRRRMEEGRLARAGTLLSALGDERAVRLTEVRVGGDFSVEGFVVGPAARIGLQQKLAAAGVEAARLQMPASGACRPFRAGDPRPFAERTVALCTAESQPHNGTIAVRGKAGDGGLSISLRDIDLADFFFVLHDLTGESFVVDHDVRGRVDVAVQGASLDEVLAAVRSLGLTVSGGPLRRVSRPGAPPIPSKTYAGEPTSFVMQDADLRGLLCVFEKATGLFIDVSPALSGRVSLYTRELPWDQALDAVIAGTGNRYAIDGHRLFVGSEAALNARKKEPGENACESLGKMPSPPSDVRLQLKELASSDVTVAGSARGRDGWRGYVYGAWRQLHAVEANAPLFDATVASVGAAGLTFAPSAR